MDSIPLGLERGDIIHVTLVSPLIYSDGHGGEELRHTVRLEVHELSALGLTGGGAELDEGIVPIKRGNFEKIGGDKPEFFPWSAILRMSLMYKAADYQRVWDQYEANAAN
ncbi:hypothetical protein E3O19_10315 [Cryobacterium algoritolerans]|uniref:Uncharacterized protein n=1 Tax=Cryobacterium algoritolerans TaxID=1259184 RepID=A0A4R8WQH5_9MICO|nr:hypothetical protein [Cryobacterium algoritolerans]TFC14587.1 hypothetical protein E3O19_10315 [Cryobacterium algoritolerans]